MIAILLLLAILILTRHQASAAAPGPTAGEPPAIRTAAERTPARTAAHQPQDISPRTSAPGHQPSRDPTTAPQDHRKPGPPNPNPTNRTSANPHSGPHGTAHTPPPWYKDTNVKW